MNFFITRLKSKKFIKTFLILSIFSVSLSACAPFFQFPKPPNENVQITKLDNQTFAEINNKKYLIKTALEDYLKNTTGARNLAKSIVDLLIGQFFESIVFLNSNLAADVAVVANKLLSQLSIANNEVNNNLTSLKDNAKKNNENDLEKQTSDIQLGLGAAGGNEIRYKKFNVLNKLRSDFITDLLDQDYLNYDGKDFIDQQTLDTVSNWKNLKFENNNLTDPIAKIFSHFQKFLFNDWFDYIHPVPVIKITWKYAEKDLKNNTGSNILDTIYDKDKLALHGISLPDQANYNFPAFDNVSNKANNTGNKYKNFIENIKNIISSDGVIKNLVNNFSDDNDNNFKVLSLTNLGDELLTSQETAAILQLYNSNSKLNEPAVNATTFESIEKNEILANFLKKQDLKTKSTDTKDKKEESNVKQNDFLGINIDGDIIFKSTNNKIVKDNKIPNTVFDIIQITDSTTNTDVVKTTKSDFSKVSENLDKKWILYKDENGAHAITIDGIGKLNSDKDFLKKLLLWRAMRFKNKISTNTGYNYDLISDLKTYLKDNFDAIMLRYLVSSFTTADTNQINTVLEKANQSVLTSNSSIINTNNFNGILNNLGTLLFNGTYNPFWHNNNVKQKNSQIVDLLTKTSNLLNATFFKNKLFNLRKKLTASYANFVTSEPFAKTELNDDKNSENKVTYFANLANGLASKLPFKINADYTKNPIEFLPINNSTSNTKTNDEKTTSLPAASAGGYSSLEKVYFNNETSEDANNVYSKYFAPESIAKNYQDYIKQLKNFFSSVSLNTNFIYDSEEAKKVSRFIHFALDPGFPKDNKLLLTSINQDLMEYLKITADGQNGFGVLIRQKLYAASGVDYFYDFSNNSFKNFTNPSGWNFNESFNDSLKRNLFYIFLAKDFIDAPIKQIFGGYNTSDDDHQFSSFNKLLERMWYQKFYVDSDYGFDTLSVDQLNNYQFFLALKWLIGNGDFFNFRNYLAQKIGFNGSAAFVWQNQNRKTPSLNSDYGTKNLSSGTDYHFNQNPQNILNSPYISDKSFAAVTNFNLPSNNWSFAKVNHNNSNQKTEIGFKGLLFPSDVQTATNSAVSGLLFNNFQRSNSTINNKGVLYNWSSFNNLVQSIKNVKTFRHLNQITDALAIAFPSVSFENVHRTTIKSPVANSQIQNLNLSQKINALLNVIYGNNITYRTDSEKIFKESTNEIYNTTPLIRNSNSQITDAAFNVFGGSIKNGINNSTAPYAISDSDSSFINYVAYMQQINFEDVNTIERFKAYMKEISADVFMQTLLKTAQDLNVQKEANFDFLNNINFKPVVVFDQSLKNSLGPSWSIVKSQKQN